MRIKRNSGIAICLALMIGCAVAVVASRSGDTTPPAVPPVGPSSGAAVDGADEAGRETSQAGTYEPAAGVGEPRATHERLTPTCGDPRVSGFDPYAASSSPTASGGDESLQETDGSSFPPVVLPANTNDDEPWDGTPTILRIGSYEPDPNAPPVDPIAPVRLEDLADAHATWMSSADGWVTGFLASDGHFFRANQSTSHSRPGVDTPPPDAPTISDVGESRISYLSGAVHFRIVEEGKYVLPIVVLDWDSRQVARYLSFDGQEPLLTRALLTHPSERTSTNLYMRVVELAADAEVVTIPPR